MGPRLPAVALAFAAVSISAGIAIMVAPLGHTQAWNLPTAYAADLLLVPLFVVFTFVSLALPPRAPRHRPLRYARAGAAAGGTAGGSPTKAPDRCAVSAVGTG